MTKLFAAPGPDGAMRFIGEVANLVRHQALLASWIHVQEDPPTMMAELSFRTV